MLSILCSYYSFPYYSVRRGRTSAVKRDCKNAGACPNPGRAPPPRPPFFESWPAPWDLYAGTSDRVDGPPSTGCDSSDAEGVEAAVALTAKWSRGPVKGPVSNRA